MGHHRAHHRTTSRHVVVRPRIPASLAELEARGLRWGRMDGQQESFLKDEFFDFTIRGAFQVRGGSNIYDDKASSKEKEEFRDALRLSLEQLIPRYCAPVSEEDHIQNIVDLSEELSRKRAGVLKNKRFRIGIAQKALNLYLKYLWCLGKVPTPPHCPFDRNVIEELPNCSEINWTELDNPEGYRKLVAAAKEKAGTAPLAQWELELSNGHSPGSPAIK